MVRTSLAAVLVAFLISCASIGYRAEFKGLYVSLTGRYTVFKATPAAVRNTWDKRNPDLKGLPVDAFTDWNRKEIWYTTEESLDAEKAAASSYKALRGKAYKDEADCLEFQHKNFWPKPWKDGRRGSR